MNRKMKMKKAIFGRLGIFFCLSTVIFFMAGCGGKYSEVSESERAVSGPAVSGQAISDSDGASRYTYCSDWNLYYVAGEQYSDETRFVERNLESGAEREIPVDNIHEICYVDNDWVYYAKKTFCEEDGNSYTIVGEFCRSPIDKSSFQMDEKAEELLLKEDNNVGMVVSRGHVGTNYHGIKCNGRYIVYQGSEWEDQSLETLFLRVYDIQSRSYVHEEIFRDENFWDDIGDVELCGDSVFLYDEEEDELVCVKLETGEKLTVAPFENYQLNGQMQSSISTTSDEAIFWGTYDGEKKEIWQYCLADQKSLCLITDEEFRELLGQKGLLECSLGGKEHVFNCWGCFVRANRLYVQVGIEGEGNKGEKCRNCVVLSKELGKSDAALVYEEKLNECLANPEGRRKVFTKKYDGIYGRQSYEEKAYFKCRGFCVSMTEEECLLYLENEDEKKNMPARYDFQTGSLHFLKKEEKWLPKYLYAANNRVLTGDSGNFMEPYYMCDNMPNNYDYRGD